jgi:signal transduction histidine kinase
MQEQSESENTQLMEQLHYAHHEVQGQLKEIKLQNEAINQQNEQIQAQNLLLESRYQELLKSQIRMIENRKDLESAKRTIESQRQILANENRQLELELLSRNKDLERTIQDLMQYNNNLTQYSYMVSHNLRGPVASILGLMNLVPREKLDSELTQLYEKLNSSVHMLDSVIKDMNTIIDAQRSMNNVKEKIYWSDLIRKNLLFFNQQIEEWSIHIETNFDAAPYIISIRTTLDSIIYNLISNAIKFRSPYRTLKLKIETNLVNDMVVFQITDNGLGIDMASQKENMFKMYKRLHTHVEGKGLGLYMVKLQTEILNGRIEVDSKLNEYTVFTLSLPVSQIEEQTLFEKEYGRIIYNALSNSTQIQFKRHFTSQEYREIYTVGLDCFKRFKVGFALADIRDANTPEAADQQWLLEQIAPDASRSGLRKVAIVSAPLDADQAMEHYLKEIEKYLSSLHIEQRYFLTPDEANKWLNNP